MRALILLLLAVCGAAQSSPSLLLSRAMCRGAATACNRARAASAGFSIAVSGNHFVDGTGATVQLRGVNTPALESTPIEGWANFGTTAVGVNTYDNWADSHFDQNATSQGEPPWSTIRNTWKSNVVRIPLNEASWLGYTCYEGASPYTTRNPDPGGNHPGVTDYKSVVAAAVADATAAGLYVILDLHWTAPQAYLGGTLRDVCPLTQTGMSDTAHSVSFWTSVANTFKSNPAVMFELFNEPYLFWTVSGTDWANLMVGGSITQYLDGLGDTNYYNPANHALGWPIASMSDLLTAVRNTGATNVVLVASIDYSQDMSGWLANVPADPHSPSQIAAVWHAYSFAGDGHPTDGDAQYTYGANIRAAGYPVIITETGDHNATGTTGAPLVQNVLTWADSNAASYLAWCYCNYGADDNPDNVLIKDSAGTPSDGFGVYYKAHMICRDNASC